MERTRRTRGRLVLYRCRIVSVSGTFHPGCYPWEYSLTTVDRPLLPSTCQSVRMDFLALAPGVHSIDTLTLTDIQSEVTMNLKYVVNPEL